MEVNTGRNLLSFPHCARVFLCQDVLGITDVRMATDAYQFILENGIPFVNEVSSGANWGNVYSYSTQLGHLASQAVVGITNGFQCLVSDAMYSTEAVGELRPDCDGFQLDICFRMLTDDEFRGFSSSQGYYASSNGEGYRAQRVRVTLQNQAVAANSSTYVLLDVFADYAYYSANVQALPALSNAVNTIDLATSIAGIYNYTVIGTIPATLLRASSCQASCFFRYEMPLAPDGNAWTAPPALVNAFGNMFTTAGFSSIENPIIGPFGEFALSAAGILSTSLHTFFTGLGTVPSGAAGGTGGTRTVSQFQNQTAHPLPSMGGTMDFNQFAKLRLRGLSSIGASWPAISVMSRNFGGALKPICGNGGTYKESDGGTHTMTTYIQCPHGSTNYVLIAKVRTINIVGSTHTVDFQLTNSDNTSSQTLASTTQAAGTGYRYVYVNGALSLPMRPAGQLVERYELRIRAIKSVPRVILINEPYLADGCIAVYIAFYQ